MPTPEIPLDRHADWQRPQPVTEGPARRAARRRLHLAAETVRARRAARTGLGAQQGGRLPANVTDSATVIHRCEYRAAAHDRKLYADEIYRQLRETREAVLAIHKPADTWTHSTLDLETGVTEQNALYADNGTLIYAPNHRIHCQVCPVDTPWPCPTAQACGVTA